MFLAPILATFGVNAMDSRTALKQEVDAGRQALDHIAPIGRWRYEIYVNRNISPPAALARITKESWAELFALPEADVDPVTTEQSNLVRAYLESITGVPIPRLETSTPAGRASSRTEAQHEARSQLPGGRPDEPDARVHGQDGPA
ncbi:hypothetical protein [Ideonella sp. YS5]|uniref:hypothetical protein n=1 Tax=Ideonella sp. YS5 TaxID=3453714 RepID=UPI003EE8510B